MALNMGNTYLGMGKESTYGTAVNPTLFAVLEEPADLEAEVPMIEVPNVNAFGNLAFVPGIRSANLSANVVATPKSLGALLAALMGAPSSTGSSPNYTHVYVPKLTYPSYTFEGKDGSGRYRVAGSRLGEINFDHTPDGYLRASIAAMGKDKAAHGSDATVTLETDFFYQSHLVATLDSVNISSYLESVSVGLGMGKEKLNGFGSATIAGIDADGTADATIELTIRADGNEATRFADYIAASVIPLDLTWTINANTELKLDFANVVLTSDPTMLGDKGLGTARINLQLRAVAQGADLIEVTLKNQQATY